MLICIRDLPIMCFRILHVLNLCADFKRTQESTSINIRFHHWTWSISAEFAGWAVLVDLTVNTSKGKSWNHVANFLAGCCFAGGFVEFGFFAVSFFLTVVNSSSCSLDSFWVFQCFSHVFDSSSFVQLASNQNFGFIHNALRYAASKMRCLWISKGFSSLSLFTLLVDFLV